jgi:hypothetical protein
MRPWAQAKRLPWLSITPPTDRPDATWQQLLLSLGRGRGCVPLGLTLIKAQKYARRAEHRAYLQQLEEAIRRDSLIPAGQSFAVLRSWQARRSRCSAPCRFMSLSTRLRLICRPFSRSSWWIRGEP